MGKYLSATLDEMEGRRGLHRLPAEKATGSTGGERNVPC